VTPVTPQKGINQNDSRKAGLIHKSKAHGFNSKMWEA